MSKSGEQGLSENFEKCQDTCLIIFAQQYDNQISYLYTNRFQYTGYPSENKSKFVELFKPNLRAISKNTETSIQFFTSKYYPRITGRPLKNRSKL